jgi:RimJ/RimL family protein N-acetyltransferase
MALTIHPMDRKHAEAIVKWRYDAPYDLYNSNPDEADHEVRSLIDPANGYYSVCDEHRDLIAYICFGPDARVAGGDYDEDALDVGCGIRPDLTGRGLGPTIIQTALDIGNQNYHPVAFRATIAAFNQRALKASQRVGFVPRRTFYRPSDQRPFVILTRVMEHPRH